MIKTNKAISTSSLVPAGSSAASQRTLRHTPGPKETPCSPPGSNEPQIDKAPPARNNNLAARTADDCSANRLA